MTLVLWIIAAFTVIILMLLAWIEFGTKYSVIKFFNNMLRDDSGEPSPKLFSGMVGVIIIAGLAFAHSMGVDIDVSFLKSIIWFTLIAFGVSEGGRVLMKRNK